MGKKSETSNLKTRLKFKTVNSPAENSTGQSLPRAGSPKKKAFPDTPSDSDSIIIPYGGNISLLYAGSGDRKAHDISDTDEDVLNIAKTISATQSPSKPQVSIRGKSPKEQASLSEEVSETDMLLTPESDGKDSKKKTSRKRKLSGPETPKSVTRPGTRPKTPKSSSVIEFSDEQTEAMRERGHQRQGASHSRAIIPGPVTLREPIPDNCNQIWLQDQVSLFVDDLEDSDVELFICQVPAQMDVEQLQGKSLNTSEAIELDEKLDKGITKTLEIAVTEQTQSEMDNMTVICRQKEDGQLYTVNKRIQGSILVSERVDLMPYVIPPIPPKVCKPLPSGLKQRHVPFGSEEPTLISAHKDKTKKKKKKKSNK